MIEQQSSLTSRPKKSGFGSHRVGGLVAAGNSRCWGGEGRCRVIEQDTFGDS